MKEKRTRTSAKAGLPPGSLVHIGRSIQSQSTIEIVRYNTEQFEHHTYKAAADFPSLPQDDCVKWIHVHGVQDTELIRFIGDSFKIHPLALEDIMNTEHRPKIEDYDQNLFFTFRLLTIDPQSALHQEQISIVLTQNSVISFSEDSGDFFNPVREQIKQSKGKIRTRGADYLCYALIDYAIDQYFHVVETIEDQIATLEENLFKNTEDNLLSLVRDQQRTIVAALRATTAFKESLSRIIYEESPLIEKTTLRFYGDILDHLVSIHDSLENSRENNASLREVYASQLSLRMTQTMQILTIISTLFIPLTFIAGIYGMNFEYMPELKTKYGYLIVWIVMLAVAGSLLWFFHKKKWI